MLEETTITTIFGNPTMPSLTLRSSIDPEEPQGDVEAWEVDRELTFPFLVTVVRYHSKSDMYDGELNRDSGNPYEYHIDVLGDNKLPIHDSYWILEAGKKTKEEALQGALLRLQALVLPINKLSNL